jgi:glycerophosphoryl diester phosphodiesterase
MRSSSTQPPVLTAPAGRADPRRVDDAQTFDADAISPVHGAPQTGSVPDTDYRPYTMVAMVAMVDAAHAAGMRMTPWTVDDIATMNHLIDIQVTATVMRR